MNRISKIRVDRDLCIGAAPCISTAPEVFRFDEENKAVIKIKRYFFTMKKKIKFILK